MPKPWLVIVLFLALVPLHPSIALAQSNWQRQQQWQQQEQMRRQQEDMRRQQAQMQRQREDMMRQQRLRQQQMQEDMRRRQANQNARVQQSRPATGAPNPRSGGQAIRPPANTNAATRLTRALTPSEIKRGFTGKFTGDGRALVRFQGRIFAVPARGFSGLVRTAAAQNSRRGPPPAANDRGKRDNVVRLLASRPFASAGGSGGGGSRTGGPPANYGIRASQAAQRALKESRSKEDEAAVQFYPVTLQVIEARKRAAGMYRSDTGFNISSLESDQYETLGEKKTYLTDRVAVERVLQLSRKRGRDHVVSRTDAANIERELGLQFGTLEKGFTIRKVRNLSTHEPAPARDGNRYNRGTANHLPGGHPEVTTKPIRRDDKDVEILARFIVE